MSMRWDTEEVPPTSGRDFLLGLLFVGALVGLMWLGSALGTWLAGPTP